MRMSYPFGQISRLFKRFLCYFMLMEESTFSEIGEEGGENPPLPLSFLFRLGAVFYKLTGCSLIIFMNNVKVKFFSALFVQGAMTQQYTGFFSRASC